MTTAPCMLSRTSFPKRTRPRMIIYTVGPRKSCSSILEQVRTLARFMISLSLSLPLDSRFLLIIHQVLCNANTQEDRTPVSATWLQA